MSCAACNKDVPTVARILRSFVAQEPWRGDVCDACWPAVRRGDVEGIRLSIERQAELEAKALPMSKKLANLAYFGGREHQALEAVFASCRVTS